MRLPFALLPLALAACSTAPVVIAQDLDTVTVEYNRTFSSPEEAQRVATAACGPGRRAEQRAMVRHYDTNSLAYLCRS